MLIFLIAVWDYFAIFAQSEGHRVPNTRKKNHKN